MIIKSFSFGPLETNVVLVACPTTKEAALIDAPQGCAVFLKKYIGEHSLKVKMILLTHSHWDHIADLAELKEIFKVPVYVHLKDARNVEQPGADKLPLYFPIQGIKEIFNLQEHEHLPLGKLTIKVIHTPGHSPGSVCFYFENEKVLVSGDTLFCGTIGRLDLPTGEAEKIGESLHKLSLLHSYTVVYPGHGQTTTIGKENAFLRRD